MRGRCCRAKEPQRRPGGHGARVARLAEDTDEAVLGDGAGRPAVADLLLEPSSALLVQDVIAIQEGQQNVDVEQCAQVDLEAN